MILTADKIERKYLISRHGLLLIGMLLIGTLANGAVVTPVVPSVAGPGLLPPGGLHLHRRELPTAAGRGSPWLTEAGT